MQPRNFGLARVDAQAVTRGPLWSALAVVLATLGCSVPGPKAKESALEPMRRRLPVGAPLNGTGKSPPGNRPACG